VILPDGIGGEIDQHHEIGPGPGQEIAAALGGPLDEHLVARADAAQVFAGHLRPDQPDERYLWTEAPNDMMLQYLKDGEQGLLWLRSCEIDRQYKLSRMSGYASYLQWLKSRN
jgi:hypothetical protein